MESEALKKVTELIEKADHMKKQEKMDLSSDQDLSIAVMNLISIEEHFIFSGAKTGKPEYYDLVNETREMRKQLLKKLVKDPEGEVWCISKHLLAASMRLMEVGTKQQSLGRKEDARELFEKAYALYSLFWGLNMNVISAAGVTKIEDSALDKKDDEKKGFMGKLGALVKKAVDCCIE